MVVLREWEFMPEVIGLARDELIRRQRPAPSPEEYWRDFPDEWRATIGFCYACWAQTSDESPGDTRTVNLIGTAISGEAERCNTCGSVVKTKSIWLVFPLIPLARYRVIRLGGNSYIGRKLKKQ